MTGRPPPEALLWTSAAAPTQVQLCLRSWSIFRVLAAVGLIPELIQRSFFKVLERPFEKCFILQLLIRTGTKELKDAHVCLLGQHPPPSPQKFQEADTHLSDTALALSRAAV